MLVRVRIRARARVRVRARAWAREDGCCIALTLAPARTLTVGHLGGLTLTLAHLGGHDEGEEAQDDQAEAGVQLGVREGEGRVGQLARAQVGEHPVAEHLVKKRVRLRLRLRLRLGVRAFTVTVQSTETMSMPRLGPGLGLWLGCRCRALTLTLTPPYP